MKSARAQLPYRLWCSVGPSCARCRKESDEASARRLRTSEHQEIAEQTTVDPDEDEPLIDFESEVELAVFGERVLTWPECGRWDDTDPRFQPVEGPDFVLKANVGP